MSVILIIYMFTVLKIYDLLVFCGMLLIFYVGDSSTGSCSSIISCVIVGCVVIRWKMNDHFSRKVCTNTVII